MLKLSFIWPNKTKSAWLRAGIDQYIEKIGHYIEVQVLQVRGIRSTDPQEVMRHEARSILRVIPRKSFVIALYIEGPMLDSPGLARKLDDLEAMGVRDLSMVIGGPFGLAPSVISMADECLSLSRMTFTHDMTRLILAEQVYRACTIRACVPYHH
jgi:23S rRNA (pseudouridine1915-N3)-methyltransferase